MPDASTRLPSAAAQSRLLAGSGVLFGLGLGGFFDGIVLHQLLQWHHMVSSWYPTTTLENLRLNTLWDGIFHSTTYVFVVLAVYLFWKASRRQPFAASGRLMVGTALVGWGLFNVLEGTVDHEILGIHHVNERVASGDFVYWDIGFLIWGLLMAVGGWRLYDTSRRAHAHSGTA